MSDIVELKLKSSVALAMRTRVVAYWELTKPGIAAMVLVITALGYCMAASVVASAAALTTLIHTVLATAMVGGAANALNQYIEIEPDRLMDRTRNRPLPSGRIAPAEALAFGVVLGLLGAVYLWVMVNPLASAVALCSLFSYVLVYTPLKRVTSLSVLIGAAPGALPPVIGWTAATGSLDRGAWLLFAILFLWQLPHFAAIAWLYRADYRRGGFPVLPVIDPTGLRTTVHVITHTIGLVAASVLPVLYGLAGPRYAVVAVLLGLAFLAFGALFVVRKTDANARLHLLASLVYLPALFIMMLVDKIPHA